MHRSRLIASLIVIPAVVVGLAACSGSGSSKPSATATASSTPAAITSCPTAGSASKAISASGAFNGSKAPTVTFKKGLSAEPPQVSALSSGTGAKLKSGDLVQVSYTVYQASKASKIGSVGFDQGSPQVLSVGGSGFGAVLTCTRIGERFALVGSSTALGFGTTGQIVVVGDVVGKTSPYSTGAPQPQSSSLPTVKDGTNGEPQITIPSTPAPSTTQAEVIKQGDGATIAEGDSALVQYKGEVYSTGKVFDSTWSRGQPTTFTIAKGQLIDGFVTGLVGQKVGSQVLIVMPASAGYGASPPEGSNIPANAALVFVVDILAKS
ncbi:FKBP-type peptidyl-prolyl cis-trans isomerase [Curtobacterium ammoniigenes]|uniref:FKBP-type peptidyl-prolyl cis-trans isomerase n=1 Tax=Curtobacterium ammoniigenes TaxID=395387 RepID=UPI00082A1239|nr:FKBP-type peptidyl-prolyl cis-trans isomerase [Curtobacterium ammoniigenes]